MNKLDNLSPKSAFGVGLGAALIIFFIIGFFVLLSMVMGGGKSAKVAEREPGTVLKEAPSPSAGESGTQVKLAAITSDDHILGNPDVPITVVEFSDTECPFCKRFHPTMHQLISEFDGQVNWVYKHFPLDSLHSKARKEAEATECAAELGGNDAFWKYLDKIFEETPSNNGLDSSLLPEFAVEIGLDKSAFVDCLDSGRMSDIVAEHLSQAGEAGGRGTPYSVIIANGRTIPVSGAVPYEKLKSIIEPLLK